VYLWRHARTAHNRAAVWQGQLDTDLDDVGRRQAKASAEALAHRLDGVPFRLVTSDLRRAVDTAAALTALTGVPAVPDPRLREVDAGLWEGLTRDEVEAAGMGAELAAWRRGEDVPVGRTGERRSEVGRRGAAGITEHAAAVPVGGALVVASHGGVLRGSILALLGLDPGRWQLLGRLRNGQWAELLVRMPARGAAGERGAWTLVAYNACGREPLG
jgi:probable phosphoglycerate mutase